MCSFFRDVAERAGKQKFATLLPLLPRKRKDHARETQAVHNLSRVQLPEKVQDVLAKGPKFAAHPQPKPLEPLAMVHTVANWAPESGKAACITEGVDCVTGCKRFAKVDLCSCMSDETGDFAVLDEAQYQEKAEADINKTFQREEGVKENHLKKMRTSAEKLCNELGLEHLAKAVKSSTQVSLRPFFTLKTH
ncbi:hypothetical protein HPB48_000615 [Haemaphysalis longicornis]|uniref:Uncharacterized protein n=1 Tax=Haemaphysalis longicornis TaxID=44386 RepID=A0A9J6FVG9_HAELO|nr:hypothetical protein HPB48_000615 [Haemaphysalis longicornis]